MYQNRKRPLIDQEVQPGLPVPGLIFAQVDSSGHPAEGEPGYGTKHCTRLVPSTSILYETEEVAELGVAEEPGDKYRFCVPWSGTVDDIPNGARVWLLEYGGLTIILLVEC